MSDSSAASPPPFDLDQLQQLFERMEQHGVTDVSLRHGNELWRVRRGGHVAPVAYAPPPPQYAPAVAPVNVPAPAPAAAPKDDGLLTIKAPTVGTFYSAQTPEDPPFVTVGAKISPQTTVCLIEAMKVFNPIPAELSGTVEAMLVKNGDSVEFGQPLFKVRP
jgi:acetyl-CoA carboxylase biotin carboxyl carrier protein